jgi:hypothetical protein
MDERLTFVRAEGAQAVVSVLDAWAIANALWELGILIGAATATTSIADTLRTRPRLRRPVRFSVREGEALSRASGGRLRWSSE